MSESIVILGSTGSVGTQTLEVCEHIGSSSEIKIFGICCNENIKLCEEQIRKFKPKYCAVYNEKTAAELKILTSDTNVKIISGEQSLCELASSDGADVLVNSLSGQTGLKPTLAAIKSKTKKRIALANKESLVVAGELVMALAKENNVDIIPMDSEHSAILQCKTDSNKSEIKKIILTASGGPFFGKTRKEIENVSVKEALNHPTWSMGKKISIDSATLMNKGLELIEAKWLFGTDDIDVIVHRESIIHSMVEYMDNSIMAQLGTPDMRMCIQYALLYPSKQKSLCKPCNLADIGTLSFYKVDNDTFPFINLARYAIEKGGLLPAVMNSANEAAVNLFLNGKIKFCEIYNITEEMVYNYTNKLNPSEDEIFEAINNTTEKINKVFNRGD